MKKIAGQSVDQSHFLKRLEKLELNPSDSIVVDSGIMAVLEIRQSRNIDLIVESGECECSQN